MEAVILFIIMGSLFGIFYLYFSTRNKERMALIEKGADASIFARGKSHTAPFWKVFILNVALLLIGIGIGTFIALVMYEYTSLGEGVYPATIFLMAGIALFVGYTMTKKMED